MYQVQFNKKGVKAKYFVEFNSIEECKEYINKKLDKESYNFIKIVEVKEIKF